MLAKLAIGCSRPLLLRTDHSGWLIAALSPRQNRSALPDVETPLNEVLLVASIWPDLGLPPLFGEEVWSEDWPKRIQRKDLQHVRGRAIVSLGTATGTRAARGVAGGAVCRASVRR